MTSTVVYGIMDAICRYSASEVIRNLTELNAEHYKDK
jgi:hypothetical protein